MSEAEKHLRGHQQQLDAHGTMVGVSRQAVVEVLAELTALRESEKFYHIRCDELQIIQSRMRDPERQMVCDILANGKPRDKAGIGDYALPQEKGE